MIKPVRRSARARDDINQASDYYADTVAGNVARRFVDELDAALTPIAEYPATGSPRYASEARIDGLRFWTLRRFPYAIFYVERDDAIDVLRVLHQASDLPHHLT